LIDELWGDAPPPTVNAALNGYLTKLRRLLANGAGAKVLSTQAPGYVLSVAADGLDAVRFERLVERGRSELVRGDAAEAAGTLRDALGLWRGAPLADLAYEEFAQQEIRRLEELRLSALEERIEADLTLGRHDALAGELEALVGEHPYRERLRAHLIVALYRSGRQAEALNAYQAARRTLLDDLGIEPSRRLQELEHAILEHDCSLEPPAAAAPARARDGGEKRRRRVVLAAAAALVLVAALATIAAIALRDPSAARPIVVTAHSLVVVDPETVSVVDAIPIGGTAAGIAVGEGSVWVGNADDRTLLRIDPETRAVRARIPLDSAPSGVAVGAGTVWVLSEAARTVARVDVATETVLATIPVRGRLINVKTFPPQIVVGGGSVWVDHGGAVSRIDPATDTATTVRESGAPLIAYGDDALWVAAGVAGEQLARLDPRTGGALDRVGVDHVGRVASLGVLAAAAGALWGRPFSYTTLFKFDANTGSVLAAVPAEAAAAGIALGDNALWVVLSDNALLRVNPESARVVKRLRLPLDVTLAGLDRAATGTVVAGEDAVWILVE
jgi:DNA-binding SARP family transcriptional activator/outer membrane protein assembly factor BamB